MTNPFRRECDLALSRFEGAPYKVKCYYGKIIEGGNLFHEVSFFVIWNSPEGKKMKQMKNIFADRDLWDNPEMAQDFRKHLVAQVPEQIFDTMQKII